MVMVRVSGCGKHLVGRMGTDDVSGRGIGMGSG